MGNYIKAGETLFADWRDATFDYAQKNLSIQNKYLSTYEDIGAIYSITTRSLKTWNDYCSGAIQTAKVLWINNTD